MDCSHWSCPPLSRDAVRGPGISKSPGSKNEGVHAALPCSSRSQGGWASSARPPRLPARPPARVWAVCTAAAQPGPLAARALVTGLEVSGAADPALGRASSQRPGAWRGKGSRPGAGGPGRPEQGWRSGEHAGDHEPDSHFCNLDARQETRGGESG